MRDEYINGTNVKKFILPGQNHGASFSSNTDIAKCNAIRAALDAVFGAPQGIEEISYQPSAVSSQKVLRDGQLIIRRNGVEYNLNGQQVR